MATKVEDETLTGALYRASEKHGDSLAVKVMEVGPEITHAELQQAVDNFAAQIYSAGIQPGELVSLAFLNTIEFVVAFLGVTRARAVAAPLNSAYTEDEFTFFLQDAKSKLLLLPTLNPAAAAESAARKLSVPVAHLSPFKKPEGVTLTFSSSPSPSPSSALLRALDQQGVLKLCVEAVSGADMEALHGPGYFLLLGQLGVLQQVALFPSHVGVETLANLGLFKKLSWGAVFRTLKVALAKNRHAFVSPWWNRGHVSEFLEQVLRLLVAVLGLVCSLGPDEACRRRRWVTVLWDDLQELVGAQEELFSALLLNPSAGRDYPAPSAEAEQEMGTFRLAVHFVSMALSNQRVRQESPALSQHLYSLLGGLLRPAEGGDPQASTLALSLFSAAPGQSAFPSARSKTAMEKELLSVKLHLLSHLQVTLVQGDTQGGAKPVGMADILSLVDSSADAIQRLRAEGAHLLQKLSELQELSQLEVEQLLRAYGAETEEWAMSSEERRGLAQTSLASQVTELRRMAETQRLVLERGLEVAVLQKRVNRRRLGEASPAEWDQRGTSALVDKLSALVKEGESASWGHVSRLVSLVRGYFF